MSVFRFLHSSDLHLGKRFGNFPDEPRAALAQARAALPRRLAEAARAQGAAHILLAGDTFDTETPSDRVVRQALTAMAADPALQWWIIPGNHDSLAAEPLWQSLAEHAPPNAHLLTRPAPVEMAPGVTLLPAPAPRRYPGVDLTAWMDGCATADGQMRIGLAHGGVLDFGSDDGSAETIAPDRAARARLDYLALGDWHGVWRLDDRTRYSGTPERDRFKHAGPGVCLAVTLAGPGALPRVAPVTVGQYDWRQPGLAVTPETDALAALDALLPPDRRDWTDTLVRLDLTGWIRLPERRALLEAIRRIAPEFCHFAVIEDRLQTEFSPAALDEIARTGALRMAADELQRAAGDDAAPGRDRAVAGAALNRLYGLVKEGGA